MEKVIEKNGAVIDSEEYADKYHVYKDNDDIYSCTLNQTDVKNNNNKFYIMQLLEGDNNNQYILYKRYGRIGNAGVISIDTYASQGMATYGYKKLFKQKTGNSWDNKNNFEKKKGKYFMSKIEYDTSEKKEEKPIKTKKIISKLDSNILSLINLISDTKIINSTMKEFNIDIKKMPLGKISKEQIKKSYEILKLIANKIENNDDEDEFVELTSEFYTLIPSSFGRRKPPIICTENQVDNYLDMLDILTNLEVTSNLLESNIQDIHPADKIYKQLNIGLTSLSSDSKEYEIIDKYVGNTFAPTHNWYTLDLLEVFKVDKNVNFKDYGNNRLLFHGSRIANFVGIFSTGLKINNNAPKTGSMFGPGSYFSNSVSKSANYCYTDHKNNIGIMLLCQVSLGNMYERTSSEYITWLPNDKFQSTWGKGMSTVFDSETLKINDKLIEVPNGKLVEQKNFKSSLLYDEFIVYNENQIKILYALKLKFNYN